MVVAESVPVSSWPPPPPNEQAGDTAPTVQAPSAQSASSSGPECTAQGVHVGNGWLQYYDHNEGAEYFYHSPTGETRWELPESSAPDVQSLACPSDDREDSSNIQSSNVQATDRCNNGYHDGYDWDSYAHAYGLPSGYHAYWEYYWGAPGASQYAPRCYQPPPAHAAPSDAASHAMSVSGSIIYEPAPAAEPAGRDAMARLDKILAQQAGAGREAAHAAELAQMKEEQGIKAQAAGDDSELTEAQKIFGTGETFANPTEWRGQKVSFVAAGASDEPRKLTAAEIAESAKRLEEAAASAHGVSINQSDVRRHGLLARQTAIEKSLLMAVENPASSGSPVTGGYEGKALFNKRTGKFEAADSVIHRIPINDPRRQTSHFFDYDKWAQEKSANSRAGKRARISLV